jgi:sugar phosphate isomerase/epimerase
MYEQAVVLKEKIDSMGMKLVVFQPISQFEGWEKGSPRHGWVRAKAEKWLPLCAKLGVGYLQLGSNDQPDATAPFESLCEDMHWIAELGSKQQPPVKISYEPWCFSVRIPSWEGCWEVVQAVNHDSLGLCVDIAHVSSNFDSATSIVSYGNGLADADTHALLDVLGSSLPRLRRL